MFITFVALVFMKSGQPALLYLVPSVLFPVTIVALLKGQFKNLWYGRIVSMVSFCYLEGVLAPCCKSTDFAARTVRRMGFKSHQHL